MSDTSQVRYLNRMTIHVAKTAIEMQLELNERFKIKDDLSKELYMKSLEDLKKQIDFQRSISVGGDPF